MKDFWYFPPTPFDAACVEAVRSATAKLGYPSREIVSGAGHDAVYVARVAPTAPNEGLVLRTRRADLSGRTPNQHKYLAQILSHDITFGIGPAGTGKTYLAVACAVDAFERDVLPGSVA